MKRSPLPLIITVLVLIFLHAPLVVQAVAGTRRRVGKTKTEQGRAPATPHLLLTIGAVDPARSFLLFGTAHDSNRPVGSEVGGHLVDATTIEFERATGGAEGGGLRRGRGRP